MAQGFWGSNLLRVSDITHFEEILKSLMHRANSAFSLKFSENFKLVTSIQMLKYIIYVFTCVYRCVHIKV